MKTFAAIDVGSYELAMKIFEFSPKAGMREIDHIRHRIDLGSDTFATGKLCLARMDELCSALRDLSAIMKSYRVDAYKVYATSAIRETENTKIILDQIRQRTGLNVEVLSNSEQRFLDYKSIALKNADFTRIIEKGTAILDIGGGSIQLSLFDKDKLVATQNLRLGVLRLKELLERMNAKPSKGPELVEEMVDSQLSVFKKLYLKDRVIEHLIIVDDYLAPVLRRRLSETADSGYIEADRFFAFMNYLSANTIESVAEQYDVSLESLPYIILSALLLKCTVRLMDAKLIWAPGVTLCDGMAYEYAEKNRLIRTEHDFEQDIVACTMNISKRFQGSRRRGETLEQICVTIFDSTKKLHGLGKRERLLLRIAAMLHDCGKYINMMNLAECSYQIVMATEIIGLSHREREIVANVVRYNHQEFDYFEVMGRASTMDQEAYLIVAKLTAILRVANGLDRSHKQKLKDIRATLKEDKLVLTANTAEDITLEKGLFASKAAFFEEVFSVKVVIRQKKTL